VYSFVIEVLITLKEKNILEIKLLISNEWLKPP